MDFTNREYQMIKTRDSLITNKISFFFQHSTEKAAKWLATEQVVNDLGFKYYKVNALAARKVLNNSKHCLKKLLITSTSAIVKPLIQPVRYNKFTNYKMASAFVLTAIKINNSIISTQQFKCLNVFYYKVSLLPMYNHLIANIKCGSHLTALSK